jgi:hypothetical protein
VYSGKEVTGIELADTCCIYSGVAIDRLNRSQIGLRVAVVEAQLNKFDEPDPWDLQ